MFLKNIQKGKMTLIVGLSFLIFSFLLGIVLVWEKEKEMKNVAPLGEVKKENVYAAIEAQVMTDYFATNDYSGREHKTYFVWDEKYLYIVDLNEQSLADLQGIYDYSYNEGQAKPSPVFISGTTKNIPTDLKDIATKAYNDLYKEDVLNANNFSDYLGVVYLDTYDNPMMDLSTSLILCLPTLIGGCIILFGYFYKNNLTKKSIRKLGNKWYMVLKEIGSYDTVCYKKAKVYLTRNFIISYTNGVEVYDYNDIVWVYPHEYRYNGVLSQKSLFIVTKDTHMHKLAIVNASKKNLTLFDKIYDTFLKRVPNALSGYTNENKERASVLYES